MESTTKIGVARIGREDEGEMQLSRMVIKNFRSLKSVDLQVAERTTCVVGENNTGKSNLIYALRLCLDVTLSSAYRALVKDDIHCDVDRVSTSIISPSKTSACFASPSRALRLSTIHNAKGREFGAIALINLREGRFPHYRADDMNAERRLFYVAITRAERVLMYIAEPDQFTEGIGTLDLKEAKALLHELAA